MILQERLLEVSRHFGWVLIPEILHNHAEESSKHNISYLEFLDKLLQEELTANMSDFCIREHDYYGFRSKNAR